MTNFQTIQRRIHRLKMLEEMEENGTFEVLTKKEVQGFVTRRRSSSAIWAASRIWNRLSGRIFSVVDPRKVAYCGCRGTQAEHPHCCDRRYEL